MLSIFTPSPGSELFQVCKALEAVDDNFDIRIYQHQRAENCFTALIPPARFFKEWVQGAFAVVAGKKNCSRGRRIVRMPFRLDFHLTVVSTTGGSEGRRSGGARVPLTGKLPTSGYPVNGDRMMPAETMRQLGDLP